MTSLCLVPFVLLLLLSTASQGFINFVLERTKPITNKRQSSSIWNDGYVPAFRDLFPQPSNSRHRRIVVVRVSDDDNNNNNNDVYEYNNNNNKNNNENKNNNNNGKNSGNNDDDVLFAVRRLLFKRTDAVVVPSSSSSTTTTTTSNYNMMPDIPGYVTSRIKMVTGKDRYEFGDIARWLDESAKSNVDILSGKVSNAMYEIGNLSRWVTSNTMETITTYRGKADTIIRDVINKIRNGEYDNVKDISLAMQILLVMGISVTPIAKALPIKLLVAQFNAGLEDRIGGRILDILARAVDDRIRDALNNETSAGEDVNNEDFHQQTKNKYVLSDLEVEDDRGLAVAKEVVDDSTKKKLQESISDFTGNDVYRHGDVTRTVAAMIEQQEQEQQRQQETTAGFDQYSSNRSASRQERTNRGGLLMINDDSKILDELHDWDERFREEQYARSFADWDRQFLEEAN